MTDSTYVRNNGKSNSITIDDTIIQWFILGGIIWNTTKVTKYE
jgi:hypothetical protein